LPQPALQRLPGATCTGLRHSVAPPALVRVLTGRSVLRTLFLFRCLIPQPAPCWLILVAPRAFHFLRAREGRRTSADARATATFTTFPAFRSAGTQHTLHPPPAAWHGDAAYRPPTCVVRHALRRAGGVRAKHLYPAPLYSWFLPVAVNRRARAGIFSNFPYHLQQLAKKATPHPAYALRFPPGVTSLTLPHNRVRTGRFHFAFAAHTTARTTHHRCLRAPHHLPVRHSTFFRANAFRCDIGTWCQRCRHCRRRRHTNMHTALVAPHCTNCSLVPGHERRRFVLPPWRTPTPFVDQTVLLHSITPLRPPAPPPPTLFICSTTLLLATPTYHTFMPGHRPGPTRCNVALRAADYYTGPIHSLVLILFSPGGVLHGTFRVWAPQ